MSDDGEKDRDRWVELRRFNDPLEADMAKDFLEKSGVPVLVRGNSGATGILNRFDTILDIRLTVPFDKLEVANEALEAMQAPSRSEEPFRGFGPEKIASHEQADENGDAPIPRKKSPFVAMGFALMLPIGGGHFYADHQAAGKMFALFILAMSVLAALGSPWLWPAVLLLIAIDMLASPFAVNRFNRDAVPTKEKQYVVVFLIGVAAMLCFTLTAR
jgi:hypothetical protein